MREARGARPSSAPVWATAARAVFAIELALAMAGCGGAKSGSSSASSSPASNPAPAGEPATAPAESSVTPPAPSGTAGAPADLGAQVFAKRCALCHGADGHGDGVGAKGLKPQPRNFHDMAYMKTRTDEQLLATIHQGKGPMPRWQGVLTEAEMKAVLAHIRSLGTKP